MPMIHALKVEDGLQRPRGPWACWSAGTRRVPELGVCECEKSAEREHVYLCGAGWE